MDFSRLVDQVISQYTLSRSPSPLTLDAVEEDVTVACWSSGILPRASGNVMRKRIRPGLAAVVGLLCSWHGVAAATWPAALPVYDHIVIVMEENKDYKEIVGNKAAAFINQLVAEAPCSRACTARSITAREIISGCSPAPISPATAYEGHRPRSCGG